MDKGCSNGLHATDNDESIKPIKNTVQVITYVVFDMSLWFKKTVNSKGMP